jgi:DNA invertase Pin-like site-specific DNA recombinase
MLIGYARVSKSDEQDTRLQTRALKLAGVAKIFESTDHADVPMIPIVCTTRSTKRERHDLVSATRRAHGTLEPTG